MTIINPFVEDGHAVNFDWAWHLAHPKETPIPGQDYNVPKGGVVRAAATGYCSWARMNDGLLMVSIHVGKDNITYRELGNITSAVTGGHVTQGQIIGHASTTLSPHWEYDHANGTYSPVEDHITKPPKPKPAPTKEEDPMPFMIYVNSPSTKKVWGHALVSADLKSFISLSQADANALVALTKEDIQVSVAGWNAFKAEAGEPVDTIV